MRRCGMRQWHLGAKELAREDLLSLLETEFPGFEKEDFEVYKAIFDEWSEK